MTPRELQTLILATPSCVQHVHSNDMSKIGAEEVRGKDQAVADALMACGALTQVMPRKIGEDDVLRELGVTAGDDVLTKLETLAVADSKVRRAMRLLAAGDLDIGHAQTQAMIDALPMEFTADEKTALKNMALRTVSVSAAEVSTALRGPWGV